MCNPRFSASDKGADEMNEHEELLDKASVCLSEASKIQDPEVRAKVLELVYHAQRVAERALVREVDREQSNHEASADGASGGVTER
jgi:hypothetical protein